MMHGRCATCRHWDEKPVNAPWSGLPQLPNVEFRPNPEREAQKALERVCRRVGGFSSSGGYGASPFGEDGKSAPSAYMLSRACGAELVTAADFGCSQWEPTSERTRLLEAALRELIQEKKNIRAASENADVKRALGFAIDALEALLRGDE